jgi:hypothetical protein
MSVPLNRYIASQQPRAVDEDQQRQCCRFFAQRFDLGQRPQAISQA